MQVKFNLYEIEFEWDVSKALLNLRNHKVSFETACEVFFDPFLQVKDAGIIDGEQREAVIGLTTSWKLLYVVYIVRDDIIRFISARLTTYKERIDYENR